ncbi:hypothetical protein LINPERHAP1_LOCUS7664, partial [Linum perenne]
VSAKPSIQPGPIRLSIYTNPAAQQINHHSLFTLFTNQTFESQPTLGSIDRV